MPFTGGLWVLLNGVDLDSVSWPAAAATATEFESRRIAVYDKLRQKSSELHRFNTIGASTALEHKQVLNKSMNNKINAI